MQPLWSLCIHFSERLPEDDFFISFIVFHPCKYAGVLSMQFDDVWRVPQHDFFQELNLLGRLWLFHLCWEATQLMEMDGKTVHLSNIVWQLVGFLNLAILMRQLQAGYQDFVTTCCQLLPTIITDLSDWSDNITGQQLLFIRRTRTLEQPEQPEPVTDLMASLGSPSGLRRLRHATPAVVCCRC